MTTTVYTDGACSGNPGPGGWAWVVPDGESAAGGDPHTTNQRMELVAALEAITAHDGVLEIVSDSTYLVNCFRDGWWKGWIARGWMNSQRKPVANRDLWEPIVDAYQIRQITFTWVKGHSGNRWNDAADQLAVAEVEKLKTTSTPVRDDGLEAGHRILVTGHRPPELGGYDDNLIATQVRGQLTQVLAAKRAMYPDLVVVSGMGLGAETIGAEVAIDLAIPLSVVLPFPRYESMWPPTSQERFSHLTSRAMGVTVRERKTPADRRQAAASIARRDAWLHRQVDEAVVIWNGADPVVERTVHGLRQSLGEEEVWVIDVS